MTVDSETYDCCGNEDFFADIDGIFGCRTDLETQAKLVTLGDLHAHVMSAMAAVPSHGGTVKMHVFYVVRRALIDGAGLKREQIKPDIDLGTLLPGQFRRSLWCNFMHKLPWDMKPFIHLKYPMTIMKPVGFVAVISFLAIVPFFAASIVQPAFGIPWFIVALGTFALSLWVLSNEPQNALATELRESCNTPRKLTRVIASQHYGKIARQIENWSENEVWEVICDIVRYSFEPGPLELTRQTTFAELEGLDAR